MPRPSNLRTREFQWHQQQVDSVAERIRVRRVAPTNMFLPGNSLAGSYMARKRKEKARERQAALVVCVVLPVLLALAVHLTW